MTETILSIDGAPSPLLCAGATSVRLSMTAAEAYTTPLGELAAGYLATRLQLHRSLRATIATALHEAWLNAIIHGNLGIESPAGWHDDALAAFHHEIVRRLGEPFALEKRCVLRMRWTPSCIFIRISDEGAGFLPSPAEPPEAMRPHGRGLAIMRGLATGCQWVEGGRTVLLRFAR